MAAEVQDIEPLEVTAGDTVSWNKDLSDFPASTWTLTYRFSGPANFSVVASASGNDHQVRVTAAASAAWASGLYDWAAFVSSGAERYKVGSGRLKVRVNPATSGGTYETRSINRQILEALELAMLERSSRGEKAYQIEAAGRSFTFHTHEELIMAIEKFRAFVKAEEDAEALARGEGTGKNIFVRFT